ncbi:hypothetical protein ACTXT7_004942 [Hymenolepis weldensis]
MQKDLVLRTTKHKSSNDSYYKLTLQSGLLKLEIRLPAEVITLEPDVLSPTTSTTLKMMVKFTI